MRSVALGLALVLVAACGEAKLPLPPVMVWAWDRAEDLRFLETVPGVGVAYLAATLQLDANEVHVHRRRVPVRYPPSITTLPVVRIEPYRDEVARLDEHQRAAIVHALVLELEQGKVQRIQVDYEAPLSQRSAYVALLSELRAAVGSQVGISVTALGSWCLSDRWMAQLSVDEIVPMFYRLGKESATLRADLAAGHDLAPECRRAIGMITDEPTVYVPSARRTYLFSPVPWREDMFTQQLNVLRQGALPR